MNDLDNYVDRFRALYMRYAGGVAYVAVENSEGDQSIGTAYHIGDNLFVTARHVIEGKSIKTIATTVPSTEYYHPVKEVLEGVLPDTFKTLRDDRQLIRTLNHPSIGTVTNVFYHPNEKVDVAILKVIGIDAACVPLGSHLDDWFGDDFILTPAMIMGYPPIPFSPAPQLVAAIAEVNAVVDRQSKTLDPQLASAIGEVNAMIDRHQSSLDPQLIASVAEVNAVVDRYDKIPHPHFILSAMARGGFSGGLPFHYWGFSLGVITESLNRDGKPVELGYMAALSVEPILNCLAYHKIMPEIIRDVWKDENGLTVWERLEAHGNSPDEAIPF